MKKSKTNSLTLSQEVSHLISVIAEKELEFFAHNDIEILHEFRVHIRKLRAWLQIFDSAGYRVKNRCEHTEPFEINVDNSSVKVLVIHTNEEVIIAQETDKIINSSKLEGF